ncbi:MAG TPA: AAA family ATPase, partial [Gaiellales bacterium]|nr:AAA family ATPase [Gaiellales bacterium]
AGVPRALLAVWSKRTADIEQEAGPKITEYEAALGRPLSAAERAKVVQTAVLKTRPVKQVEDAVTLHGRWHSEAACCGYSPGQLLDAVHAAAHTIAPGLPEEELVPAAVSAAGRRRAAFSRADVAAEIAARLPVTTATAGQVREQVERLTDAALAHRDVVGLGQLPDGVTRRRSDPRYATRELLAAEARVLAAADTGRAADLATVDPATAQAVAAAASLDADQQAAVVRLTGSGALLEVLTAPAGAGKTTTLGATAAAWRQAGLRVLGLAPTARAAAELAAATGGPTDTLAKWAHEHARGHRWLTPGLAVVVDEASRADTFTLDALIGAARSVGAKVVLVGDPAQPGVINGPGGLLGLLADRGHGITLTGVRRFAEPWERAASLHLRAGDPVAMLRYAEHDRIHPATSRVDALDAVFTRWAAAVAASTDALMLTRTRVDANALNTRARTAAIDTGAITGPTVRLGGTDWQAGDLLRTRRNDRRLPIGETHVRNGDRFQVVAVAADGLDVDDLTGRGRAWLPAGYVARHAAYGWASTIDTAQGTTADIGILYAEPGLDREHLYVGLTRGRAANHVHVNTIPTDTETHHLPIRGGATLADAIGVLTRAQARIGAEPAAHTAADRAARSRQHEPAPQRLSHTEFVEQLRALNADLARLTALLARRSCQPTAEYDHHRSTGLTPDRSPDRGMSR